MLPRFLPALMLAACAAGAPAREVPPVALPVASSTAQASSAPPPIADSRASHAKMIDVPAGNFEIGEDSFEKKHPKRVVALPAFSVDATEVTVADYAECVSAKACTLPRHDSAICNGASKQEGRRAVNCVDLRQARAFCGWVGKRLPSEEEWEAAARSGSEETLRDTWPCGDSGSPLICDVDEPHTVASDKSPLGIIGMAGNVSEWTATPAEMGKSPVSRIITKGGSYREAASKASLSGRREHAPHAAYPDLGFRCVRAEGGDLLRNVALEEVTPAPDLSEAELLDRYFAVWKKVILANNAAAQHVSAEEVDRAIKVKRKHFDRWERGTTFTVEYELAIDWATVDARDGVMVRIEPGESSLALRALPRDRWLDVSDVEKLASDPDAGTLKANLPVGKTLKFRTRAAAIAALPGSSGAKFKGGGTVELARVQWPAKDLYLVSTGVIDEKQNVCLDVVLNLVTGAAERNRNACRFH